MIKYEFPQKWISYEIKAFLNELVSAKAAIASLTTIPYQKNWGEELQEIQLKREVAGTSRIEGADFTDNELEAALKETPEQLITRSQRQAAAAVKTYRWISGIGDDKPITCDLIFEIHRLIVTDADDDHCAPGKLRSNDQNVIFGNPPHRGANGGTECEKAFNAFCNKVENEFCNHDPLIQALAAHYHLAAMHPFLDGNGRTARAVEALFLQRTGLKDTLFIAMSNYYYEEKNDYLKFLSQVRLENGDLTSFLKFGLRGITLQCNRLFGEIKKNVSKVLFRNMMYSLFRRLRTKRTRVLADRQLEILKILLDRDHSLDELIDRTKLIYKPLANPIKALMRDISSLMVLNAVKIWQEKEKVFLAVRLEWPTEITETKFFETIKQLPKSKSHSFLA